MSCIKQLLGIQLRRLRRERQWTQSELAKKVGLSMEMIGMLERGQSGASLATLERLSAVLNVPSQVLLGGSREDAATRDTIVKQINSLLSDVPDSDLDGIEQVIKAVLDFAQTSGAGPAQQ